MNILVKCGEHGEFYFDGETGLVVSCENLLPSFGHLPISVVLSDLQMFTEEVQINRPKVDGLYIEYDIDDISYLNDQGHLHKCKPSFVDNPTSVATVIGLGIQFTFNMFTGEVLNIIKNTEYGPNPIRVDIPALQRHTIEMDIPIALINGLLPTYDVKDVAYWYSMECYHSVRQHDVYHAIKYLIHTKWWNTGGRQLLCKIGWHQWSWDLDKGSILILGAGIPDHAHCKHCNKRYIERRKA